MTMEVDRAASGVGGFSYVMAEPLGQCVVSVVQEAFFVVSQPEPEPELP